MKIKKLKKWKKYYSKKKKITKLSWPTSVKSVKTFFIRKDKKKHKITIAHECQIWYLVTKPYIKRNKEIFWISYKNFSLWDSGTDRETGRD